MSQGKLPFERCEPRADELIASLRAFGYSPSMALADLIDNSIFAQARKISVDYSWNDGDPWIRITDDGKGMTEDVLREAMRLGSRSQVEDRSESDLGRFGLGLKTASFSMGRLLTVHTRTAEGEVSTRSWDLDQVCRQQDWVLSTEAPPEAIPMLSPMEDLEHGTIVLCQKLDRLIREQEGLEGNAQSVFLSSFEDVARYLEMVFHRYLSGRPKINIKVGRHRCKPWDPFLASNDFTQRLSEEHLGGFGVEVKPFVLPHISKQSGDERAMGSGMYGWNAHQGFYVYRNKRMIIPGGYLDLPFKAEEHFKLCRIQVDLPNSLDRQWCVDVRKASASPPVDIRLDLERIARVTRSKAADVYRARSGGSHSIGRGDTRHDVWIRHKKGDKIVYRINKGNDAIKLILEEVETPRNWVGKLFHLIESSVPHRTIIMDNAELEDCHVDLPTDAAPPPAGLLTICRKMFLDRIKSGKDPHSSADFVCSFFDDHPAYRAMLDKLIEEMK